LITLLLILGCIDGRDPVDVPVTFEADSMEGLDASLTLDRLTVELSNLRLLGAPDPFAWLPTPSLLPAAYAHPGHDFAGSVRAELLGTHVVDALAGPTLMGIAEGYTGDVATSRIELASATLIGSYRSLGGDLAIDVVVPLERSLSGLPVGTEIDLASPNAYALHFSTQDALAFVVFEDENDDGALTEADTAFFNTLVFGLSSLDAWTLELQ
jgi:hypothetical protein